MAPCQKSRHIVFIPVPGVLNHLQLHPPFHIRDVQILNRYSLLVTFIERRTTRSSYKPDLIKKSIILFLLFRLYRAQYKAGLTAKICNRYGEPVPFRDSEIPLLSSSDIVRANKPLRVRGVSFIL